MPKSCQQKPFSSELIARKRGEAFARRVLGCRVARPALWWSLPDIWEAIDGPVWARRPSLEQFYKEFLDALYAGTFDHRGKTRVILLNPQSPTTLEAPWPQLRMTRDRAQRIVETQCAPGASAFLSAVWLFGHHYGRHVWIEIVRAHHWLATWLDHPQFDGWIRCPSIAAALCAGAEVKPQQPHPAPPTRAHPVSTGNEIVDAAIQWLAAMAAEMVAQGDRLTREEASDLARRKFGSALSRRAFRYRVWPPGAPPEWQARGARTKAQRNRIASLLKK